jgi:hypothetical protein
MRRLFFKDEQITRKDRVENDNDITMTRPIQRIRETTFTMIVNHDVIVTTIVLITHMLMMKENIDIIIIGILAVAIVATGTEADAVVADVVIAREVDRPGITRGDDMIATTLVMKKDLFRRKDDLDGHLRARQNVRTIVGDEMRPTLCNQAKKASLLMLEIRHLHERVEKDVMIRIEVTGIGITETTKIITAREVVIMTVEEMKVIIITIIIKVTDIDIIAGVAVKVVPELTLDRGKMTKMLPPRHLAGAVDGVRRRVVDEVEVGR